MAWTYFTGPLTTETAITREQRNELLDAFLERADASPQPATADDYGAPSSYRDSPILHSLIQRTPYLGTAGPRDLALAIQDISGVYMRNAPIEEVDLATIAGIWGEAYGTNGIWTAAAAELEVTTAEAEQALTSIIDSALRWNLLREGIRLLRYPVVQAVNGTNGMRGSALEQPDFATAVSAAFAGAFASGNRTSATIVADPTNFQFWDLNRGLKVASALPTTFSTRLDVTLDGVSTPISLHARLDAASLAEVAVVSGAGVIQLDFVGTYTGAAGSTAQLVARWVDAAGSYTQWSASPGPNTSDAREDGNYWSTVAFTHP